jgi:hypothetical protein
MLSGMLSGMLSQEGYHALAILARELLPVGVRPESGAILRSLSGDASEAAREQYASLTATYTAWDTLAAMYVHQYIAPAPCAGAHSEEGAHSESEQGEQDTAPVVLLLACAYHLQARCFLSEQERQEAQERRANRGNRGPGEEGAPC